MMKKSQLLDGCVWFFLGNAVFAWLMGLSYLSTLSWFESSHIIPHIKLSLFFFTVITYLGQLAWLMLLPGFFIVGLAWIFPKRFIVIPIAIFTASISLILLGIDSFVFKLYRFHLNGMVLNLITHSWDETILNLSLREVIYSSLIVVSIFIIEILYAMWIFKKKNFFRSRWFFVFLLACILNSYLMISLNATNMVGRFYLDTAKTFPLYTNFFGLLVPGKNSAQAIEHLGEFFPTQTANLNKPLNYPLHPLECLPANKKTNVVIIAIDAWRFDMLQTKTMPYLTQFAKKSWNFTQHFSGGNATGPGIFSLFYGLPSTYWSAAESNQTEPLLLDELVKQHYQMGIFASANLAAPAFNHTVFSHIPHLDANQQSGKSPYERDQAATEKFKHFINDTHQPFFSFIFYDSTHGYCEMDNTLQPFQPTIRFCNRMNLSQKTNPLLYLNRYKNALLLVDQQVKEVIETLKSKQLLNNTILIITGDHGEEFNDNHLGFWGHAGNFSHYQVQTPLIVFFPNEKPRVFSHQTNHYDVAPTLLKKLFACQNSSSDFSLGHDLLDPHGRDYLIAGSYIGYGVIEKNELISILPGGNFEIENKNAKRLPNEKLNLALMKRVFADLERFYSV